MLWLRARSSSPYCIITGGNWIVALSVSDDKDGESVMPAIVKVRVIGRTSDEVQIELITGVIEGGLA
jgi:hypothetical protein